MAGCLGQPYVPWNYALEDLRPEKASEVCSHLAGERGSLVIHRQNDPLDGQSRVERPANSHQCVEKLRNPFQRKVFALNRDQDRVTGDQNVESDQIERRRAVNDDKGIVRTNLLN